MDPLSPNSPSLPVDRVGIEILSFAQCQELLAGCIVGRIGMFVNGEPVILPVNYRYVRGSIVFRTALGEKSDAAVMEKPVAFEIDDWDPVRESGWSVLVKGTAQARSSSNKHASDSRPSSPRGLPTPPCRGAVHQRNTVEITGSV
jgi:nitroimidazol reductase NimA-like FMN-containing flavoprotein (pyridoxamine 5'-phosphate oxidase superfamily)